MPVAAVANSTPSSSKIPLSKSSSMALALKMIKEAGVVTLPGTEFGELGEGFLRLSVCTSREEVEEGVQRLQSFIHDFGRKEKEV